jgi:hypothetical protein
LAKQRDRGDLPHHPTFPRVILDFHRRLHPAMRPGIALPDSYRNPVACILVFADFTARILVRTALAALMPRN